MSFVDYGNDVESVVGDEIPRLRLEQMLGGDSHRNRYANLEYDFDDKLRTYYDTLSEFGDDSLELNEDVDALHRALFNEQYCPEILPFESRMVTELREIIDFQRKVIDESSDSVPEDSVSADRLNLDLHLKRIELERMNYALRSYFRLRLRKIERHVQFLTRNADAFLSLSDSEQKYASSYVKILEEHFHESFLRHLPEKLQTLDERDENVKLISAPNLNQFVFCKVENPPSSEFSIRPGAPPVKLHKNDIICLPYSAVKPLLQSNAVYLI
mmetsp:Transcript_9714/g.17523  ORF Transcript_9714/g.17523 Transcript_9714/m.17523 type:complete len:271 (-) Transcript_9714:311-1123(-)|eukprot:CAMPEP_0182441282 /NCGR_PEP_ID=MMETSP1172-20130603/218_1 /TAXON_ID=708627 /ORGANISM="Timspurckia oligopyrenoides, Strain CCMP3278" /LENGTH=270 /DNA_ID=CAMNT_0024635463 /DNA_START=1057 /DNA_END=1869 /DNA_ORIENTATION=+